MNHSSCSLFVDMTGLFFINILLINLQKTECVCFKGKMTFVILFIKFHL